MFNIETPVDPSRLRRHYSVPVAIGLALIIGLVIISCILVVLTLVCQQVPLFELEYVSVSLHNVSNDNLQQTMMSEWYLAISVTNRAMSHDLAFKYINVSVHEHLTGTSMESVIPPFRLSMNQDEGKNLHAFVRGPLPSLNATTVELPFDVHVQGLAKYKNRLHVYPKEFTHGICKDMKVDIRSSTTMFGTLSGTPYRCLDENVEKP